MRRQGCILALALSASLATASVPSPTSAASPAWLEQCPEEAIRQRTLRDFSLTLEQGAALIAEQHPGIGPDSVKALAAKHYVELATIDGLTRMHRKSPRNLNLLSPDYNSGWTNRGCDSSPKRQAFVQAVLDGSESECEHTFRFSIDVPYHPAIEGDTLRVWMPFPRSTDRQSDIRLISSYPASPLLSEHSQSVHSTLYLSQPAPEPGDTAHFEYVASYSVRAKHLSPDEILSRLQPYDTASPIYRQYTAFEAPHIVRLDSLASQIVGDETNPYRQHQLVCDYIVTHYPWAGAREYSTIPCIPQYVVDERHGDCGQVALLYISLMRTLGVPARWESGWMLHPGEKNLHDWAEVYFEGSGWAPVDVSFGKYTNASDEAVKNFYTSGIDYWRLAANQGVCGQFFPQKKFIRSETVDSQLGEVECSKGNLFYDAWSQHLEILKTTNK